MVRARDLLVRQMTKSNFQAWPLQSAVKSLKDEIQFTVPMSPTELGNVQ